MPRYGDKPRKGDKVWYGYEAVPGKQPNGTVAWVSGEDVRVNFIDSRSLTIPVDEFYGKWTDKFQGCWLIEALS